MRTGDEGGGAGLDGDGGVDDGNHVGHRLRAGRAEIEGRDGGTGRRGTGEQLLKFRTVTNSHFLNSHFLNNQLLNSYLLKITY
jgi:hypothetical protein